MGQGKSNEKRQKMKEFLPPERGSRGEKMFVQNHKREAKRRNANAN